MLVGSTFAWFTDSVTSGNNKIVAGNLDVELEYWDAETQKYVSAKDAILFDEATRWEPGHAEIVYLKVSNKGKLALKYKLSTVDTYEYRFAKNQNGEAIYLSDYLELGIVADKNAAEGTFATREDALNAITDAVAYDSFTQERTLLPAAVFNDGGEIVIKGGLFSCDGIDADGRPYVLNQRDNSNGKITVYGGTFINCDPSKTGTEPAGQNDNFVAPGYKVVSETKQNGDVWYTVCSES